MKNNCCLESLVRVVVEIGWTLHDRTLREKARRAARTPAARAAARCAGARRHDATTTFNSPHNLHTLALYKTNTRVIENL